MTVTFRSLLILLLCTNVEALDARTCSSEKHCPEVADESDAEKTGVEKPSQHQIATDIALPLYLFVVIIAVSIMMLNWITMHHQVSNSADSSDHVKPENNNHFKDQFGSDLPPDKAISMTSNGKLSNHQRTKKKKKKAVKEVKEPTPTNLLYKELKKLMSRYIWIVGCIYSAEQIIVIIDKEVITEKQARKDLFHGIPNSLHDYLDVSTEGCSIELSSHKFGSGCSVRSTEGEAAAAHQLTEEATVTLLGKDKSNFAISVGHFIEKNQRFVMHCECDGTLATGCCSTTINNTRQVDMSSIKKRLFDIALLRFDEEVIRDNSRVLHQRVDPARIEVFRETIEPSDDCFQLPMPAYIFAHQQVLFAEISNYQMLRGSNSMLEPNIIYLTIKDKRNPQHLLDGMSGSLVTRVTEEGGKFLAFAYVVGFDNKNGKEDRSKAMAVPLWDSVKQVLIQDCLDSVSFED